jgi:hypothetical protein
MVPKDLADPDSIRSAYFGGNGERLVGEERKQEAQRIAEEMAWQMKEERTGERVGYSGDYERLLWAGVREKVLRADEASEVIARARDLSLGHSSPTGAGSQ